jgi:hypothetical protein
MRADRGVHVVADVDGLLQGRAIGFIEILSISLGNFGSPFSVFYPLLTHFSAHFARYQQVTEVEIRPLGTGNRSRARVLVNTVRSDQAHS